MGNLRAAFVFSATCPCVYARWWGRIDTDGGAVHRGGWRLFEPRPLPKRRRWRARAVIAATENQASTRRTLTITATGSAIDQARRTNAPPGPPFERGRFTATCPRHVLKLLLAATGPASSAPPSSRCPMDYGVRKPGWTSDPLSHKTPTHQAYCYTRASALRARSLDERSSRMSPPLAMTIHAAGPLVDLSVPRRW